MADALSDLRYISRYGYRDPWAEATKSIADSLLAYGKSKLQRDTLIAQYQEKQSDREDRKRRELKADNRYTFSQFENPEDALEWGRQDNQRLMDVFGAGGMSAGVESLEKQVGVNTQLRSYEDIVKDPNSTFLQIKDALSEAKILATKNQLTGKSSAYGFQMQQHQNKFLNESNKQFLTELAESGYDVVTDKGKWLTKAEYTNIMEDIDEGRLPQAQTVLNRLFSQKGTDLRFIKNMYAQHIASYDTAFKDDDGMWIDNISAEKYTLLRESLDKRVMKMLPTKYQNWKNPVQQNIEDAILRLDPETGFPTTDPEDSSKVNTDQKTGTVLKFNKVLNIMSPGEIKDYSGLQNVKVLNKFTGQEQVMSGIRVTQMGPNNVEILHDSKDNKNAYIELSSKYHDGLKSYVPTVKNPKDGSSMIVQKGMTVIEKSSGKRFELTGIKEIDVDRTGTLHGFGSPSSFKSAPKYIYIVNSTSHTGPNFMNEFGVPLYQEVEVDSEQGTTDTGFSTRLKASSVNRN